MIQFYQLSRVAHEVIIAESVRHFPNEAGGILVGRIESECVYIDHATESGPAAYHQPMRFKRDGNFSQKALDKLVADSSGTIDYIGEWHSHPTWSSPSHIDLESMQWIAANKAYAIQEPVLLICANSGLNRWVIRCYVLNQGKLGLLIDAGSL